MNGDWSPYLLEWAKWNREPALSPLPEIPTACGPDFHIPPNLPQSMLWPSSIFLAFNKVVKGFICFPLASAKLLSWIFNGEHSLFSFSFFPSLCHLPTPQLSFSQWGENGNASAPHLWPGPKAALGLVSAKTWPLKARAFLFHFLLPFPFLPLFWSPLSAGLFKGPLAWWSPVARDGHGWSSARAGVPRAPPATLQPLPDGLFLWTSLKHNSCPAT